MVDIQMKAGMTSVVIGRSVGEIQQNALAMRKEEGIYLSESSCKLMSNRIEVSFGENLSSYPRDSTISSQCFCPTNMQSNNVEQNRELLLPSEESTKISRV